MTTTQSPSRLERRSVLAKGAGTVIVTVAAMGAALFLGAGTVAWREGWIFIGLWLVFFVFWVQWGLRNSPGLILERGQSLGNAGKSWDKKLIGVNVLVTLLCYALAGVDAVRYQWSAVAPGLQATGLALILLAYALSFYGLKSNPYASGTVRIQTERGHKVISDGPYRYVRHPMYASDLIADFAIPLFLGSYWALIPGGLMAALFVYRTMREDQTLQEELPGYKEYAQKVRYRLVPGVW